MPVDKRRLPVPDESQSPLTYACQTDTNLCDKELVSGQGQRCDGRLPNECRPIFMNTGVISQAKGSAYIEMNQTKVICAVYGPREVLRKDEFSMNGQLLCEFKYATFCSRFRKPHISDSEQKDLSLLIQNSLEPSVRLDKFPKARMDVFVRVLQDDGGAVAAAISCASVALADAGIEMYDLVVGTSVRQCGKKILIDPCKKEEYEPKREEVDCGNNGTMTVGMMPSMSQITAVTQVGNFDINALTQLMKTCTDFCHQTYPILQHCLEKSVRKRLKMQTS